MALVGVAIPGAETFVHEDWYREAPLVLFRVGAVSLFVLIAAVVARAERRVQVGLLLTLLGATALRLWLSEPTLMGMSNYERQPGLLRIEELGPLIHRVFPDGLDPFELILRLDLVASCATPLLAFVLARLVLDDDRRALAVAALFAATPIPIAFAWSDSQFVTAVLLSLGFLALLHATFQARNPALEAIYGLGALGVFTLLLRARQISFLFAAVAVLVALVEVSRHGRRVAARTLWVGAVVAIGLLFFSDLWASRPGAEQGGLLTSLGSPHTRILSTAWANFYLFPNMTPLAITIAVVAGVAGLWRRDRPLLAYLVGWPLVFFAGNLLVDAYDLRAASRYAMRAIFPLTVLAVLGAPAIWRRFIEPRLPAAAPRRRAALAALALAVGLTFVWAGEVLRLPTSDYQEEYALLRSLADRGIPEAGARVVESYGADLGPPPLRRPRFAYFGAKKRGDHFELAVSPAEEVQGKGSTYLYLGLPCLALPDDPEELHHPPDVPWDEPPTINKACRAQLEAHDWEAVETRTVTGPRHDVYNGRPTAGGTIGLYRLRRP